MFALELNELKKFSRTGFWTVIYLLAILAVASVGFCLDPDSELARRLASASGLTGIVAAIIALILWAQTEASGQSRHKEISDKLDANNVKDEGDPQNAVPPAEAATPRKQVKIDGSNLECIELASIPLRVVGDLVFDWRQDPGNTGRWSLGDIEWALRKPGKGNFPWILKFSQDDDYVYRVSYGGKNKKERGTVTKHLKPNIEGSCE